MTNSNSPNVPIYHSPSFERNHSRRGSTRKSFTSLPLPPIDSPRTLCPRDGDAFSYDPAHLPDWRIPQHLWDQLPPKLQSALAAMQHNGAAVLTGFERLDKHSANLVGGRPNIKLDEDELLVQLEALPPPKVLRTSSNASSVFMSDLSSADSVASPALSGSQLASPVSPMCLTPSDSQVFEKQNRTRERSFTTPLEPSDAYYATELSHLRTEALPRLRHSAKKVDQEWMEVKRIQSVALSHDDVSMFENVWAELKCTILQLNEKCRRLSAAIGLSSTGMGWSAP